MGWIVKLPRPVVIQDLREDPRMTVEKVFVKDGVVVDKGLRQAGQSSGRDLLKGLH